MSSHAGPSTTGSSVGPHRHLAGFALVLVMAVGSIVMWLVSPIVWLWIASRMTSSTQPSLGPYVLVLVGMALTAVVIGKFLGVVNRTHMRVTGRLTDKRDPQSWNKLDARRAQGDQRPRRPGAGHADLGRLRAGPVRHLVLRLRGLVAAELAAACEARGR